MYSIKKIHLESTQLCQAMCPMCDRVTLSDGKLNPYITNHSLSIDDVKNIFSPSFIQNLNEMYMCGNLGDPMLAPDCIEIFKYFRKHNSKIYLSMNTNGGARKPEFWIELAKIVNHVTFSIDGLEDTNHIYRKGVSWKNVMNNVKEFIKAGGKARWDYLIFEHNEHQVELAEKLSKELGFKEFIPKSTNRYDKEKPMWQSYWRGKTAEVIKPPSKSQYQSEVMNNPLIKNIVKNRHKFNIAPKCVKHKEIYVSATGHVFPCCWAHASTCSSQKLDLAEILDMNSMVRENNAKEVGITKAIEWFDSIFERWNTADNPYICSAKCNTKQDTVKLQYVAT